MKLISIDPPSQGVVTGITYHDVMGRGVIHPVRQIQNNTSVTFSDANGRDRNCRSDADGRYVILLPPGKYKVRTKHSPYDGATPDVKEFYNLGMIEVREGATRIEDLILSTLHVD